MMKSTFLSVLFVVCLLAIQDDMRTEAAFVGSIKRLFAASLKIVCCKKIGCVGKDKICVSANKQGTACRCYKRNYDFMNQIFRGPE